MAKCVTTFSTLPTELKLNVFDFVRNPNDRARICLVNQEWWYLMGPVLWKRLNNSFDTLTSDALGALLQPDNGVLRHTLKEFRPRIDYTSTVNPIGTSIAAHDSWSALALAGVHKLTTYLQRQNDESYITSGLFIKHAQQLKHLTIAAGPGVASVHSKRWTLCAFTGPTANPNSYRLQQLRHLTLWKLSPSPVLYLGGPKSLAPDVSYLASLLAKCPHLEGLAVDFCPIDLGPVQNLSGDFQLQKVMDVDYAQTNLEAFLDVVAKHCGLRSLRMLTLPNIDYGRVVDPTIIMQKLVSGIMGYLWNQESSIDVFGISLDFSGRMDRPRTRDENGHRWPRYFYRRERTDFTDLPSR
ncbi:hypothetical protein CC86DRAFT_466873 [Ophiobolus disseminans]|uniref:F-box domain-containing protein n=1 Tax=Ophiobolus disseminans TaxID=1469910 RepID=A0A6A6ZYK9_9PLEO|nr:hypothetical protein CC86DRAFT_466873 [Ophiobolus disseminans]